MTEEQLESKLGFLEKTLGIKIENVTEKLEEICKKVNDMSEKLDENVLKQSIDIARLQGRNEILENYYKECKTNISSLDKKVDKNDSKMMKILIGSMLALITSIIGVVVKTIIS
jgi:predicted RNase H-like nuclease (RuvC/YqgF family)